MILKSPLKVCQETHLLKLFPFLTEILEMKFQAKMQIKKKSTGEYDLVICQIQINFESTTITGRSNPIDLFGVVIAVSNLSLQWPKAIICVVNSCQRLFKGDNLKRQLFRKAFYSQLRWSKMLLGSCLRWSTVVQDSL